MRPLNFDCSRRCLVAWVCVLLAQAVPARASTLYWDTNGTGTGATSGTTAPGTWGTDLFWSTDSSGTIALTVICFASHRTGVFLC